jgi:hypothetical protein
MRVPESSQQIPADKAADPTHATQRIWDGNRPVSADAAPGSRRLTMRLRPIQLLAHLAAVGPGGPKIITGWTGLAARERS